MKTANALPRRSLKLDRSLPSIEDAIGARVALVLIVAGLAIAGVIFFFWQQQTAALMETAIGGESMQQVGVLGKRWAVTLCGVMGVFFLLLYLVINQHVQRHVVTPLHAVIDRLDRFTAATGEGSDDYPFVEPLREFSEIGRRIERIRKLMTSERYSLHGQISEGGERLALVQKIMQLEADAKKRVEASLDQSEQRFRALIDNNADAILFIDASGTVRFANPTAAAVFGRPAGTLVGQPFGFPLGNGEATTIELIDPRGRIRSAEMRITAIDWENETAYVASLRDVSDRVEKDRRIRESETKFRTLFENSKDAIFFCDRKGRIVDCNRSSEVLFGRSLEALKGAALHDFFADLEDHTMFQLAVETRGAVKNYAIQVETDKGRRLECLVTASVLLSDQHEIIGYQGIIRDMTEVFAYRENLEALVARRTEELNQSLTATEEANKRITDIITCVADGLIVTDMQSRVVLMNPAAESLLSVGAEQVFEQPIAAVIADDMIRAPIQNCLEGKTDDALRCETEIPSPDGGTPTAIRTRTSVLTGVGGTVQGTVTLISDVTYEQEVNRMKTEFISTAAHELRTPLTSICGFSEILISRDDLKPAEQHRFLTYIYEQGKVLAAIINDLLDLSRIEAGARFAVNKDDNDIVNMVRSIADRFQLETVEHTFFLDLPPEGLVVSCDRGKMEQVLDNIYSNAVKYSPDGGLIETQVKRTGKCVDITIRDNGLGMTEEEVSRVFDKFYRADASNTAISGTGLGMSIVRHILEAHGGQVSVNSENGVGTTVLMRIPWAADTEITETTGGVCQQQLSQNDIAS